MENREKVKEILNQVHDSYDDITTGIAALADVTNELPSEYEALKEIAVQMDNLAFDFIKLFYKLTGF